jgi:hypothetical protein
MGLKIENKEMILLRVPEITRGVSQKSNREWVKAELVFEVKETDVAHELVMIAWNKTASLIEDMCLKRGSVVSVDAVIKSEKYDKWWRTDITIESIRFQRNEIGTDHIDASKECFVDDDIELPF